MEEDVNPSKLEKLERVEDCSVVEVRKPTISQQRLIIIIIIIIINKSQQCVESLETLA